MVLPDIPELKDLLWLKQLAAYCSTAKEDQLPDHFMVTSKINQNALTFWANEIHITKFQCSGFKVSYQKSSIPRLAHVHRRASEAKLN